MSINRKPQPLYSSGNRKCCPICGEVSYSAAGIHPQCAMQQADSERMDKIKSPPKSPKKKLRATNANVKPWQRTCPKCQSLVHVGKQRCDCGHILCSTPGSQMTEGRT